MKFDGRFWLNLAVAVLLIAPRLRIPIAGAPLYLVDVLLGFVLIAALGTRSDAGRYSNAVFEQGYKLLLVLIGLSQFYLAVSTGYFLEAVYMFGRYSVAISLVYTVPRLLVNERDEALLFRTIVISAAISAAITVSVSLPMTRGLVASTLLSNSFLEPAVNKAERLNSLDSEMGTRGISLIGASTITGAFISVFWPFSVVYCGQQRSQVPRTFALLLSLLVALGALFTYSRGAVVALVLSAGVLVALGTAQTRRVVLTSATLGVTLIAAVGIGSQIFYFDRLTTRFSEFFSGAVAGEFEHENESIRFYSYIEPFEYLVENPQTLLIGSGNTRGHGGDEADFVSHAVFSQTYRYFGMLAAVLYSGIFLAYLNIARRLPQYLPSGQSVLGGHTLLASGAAVLPWWLFGHAAISVTYGVAVLSLLVGLAMTSSRMLERQ